jgi:hypothetical protein
MFTCEQIYTVLTMICSIIFLFVAAKFITKLTHVRWEFCYFILLLFPESYSIGYYPNTTIYASLTALIGFYWLLNKPLHLLGVSLLIIAPLFRVDVLAIYPLVFLLLWHKHSLKHSIYYTALIALLVLVISGLGFWLLKANPLQTLSHYQTLVSNQPTQFDIFSFLRINISFYTVSAALLLLIGLIVLVKQGKYKTGLLLLLPVLILYYLYGDFTGAATKHLHYLLPFLAGIAVIGAVEIHNRWGSQHVYLFWIIVSVFSFQSFIGVRFFPHSKPWIALPTSVQYPSPTLLSLCSTELGNKGRMEIAIGTGLIIPTADELMLSSGNFFAPFYWQSVKREELRERKIIEKVISDSKDSLCFMTTQSSDWMFAQQLHGLGFEIINIKAGKTSPAFASECWYVHGNIKIHVIRINVERTSASFTNAFQKIKIRPLYLIARWDWQMYIINERLTCAEPISNSLSIIL